MDAQNFTFCTCVATVPSRGCRSCPEAEPIVRAHPAREPPPGPRSGRAMSAVSKPPPDWELVLKRNPVERLKREKAPLGIRDELPALIAAGYENVAEEDVVRLQWWGLYHDKPKIGTFMLRVKVPAGQLSPLELRTIGEVSNLYGRGDGELSTRQNVQLHWLELAKLPDVFAHLERFGITTAGGCGDTVRNITGCPVQGIAADELFDAKPVVDRRRRPLLRQPRLGEPAAQAQVLDLRLRRPLQRARDQLHLARRHGPRGPRGLRRPRRRRPLVGAADRAATSASSSRRRRRTRSSARSRASGRRT